MDNFCKYPNQCGIGNDCTECYQDALATANARIAELEKALEPFAEYFNRHEAFLPLGTESIAVTLRHLRRAAALLKEKE